MYHHHVYFEWCSKRWKNNISVCTILFWFAEHLSWKQIITHTCNNNYFRHCILFSPVLLFISLFFPAFRSNLLSAEIDFFSLEVKDKRRM